MIDRKKVIKALEDAYVTDGVIKMSIQVRDVLVALLKEQEAKPMTEYDDGWDCPRCGLKLIGKTASGYPCDVFDLPNDEIVKYCPVCGQEITWNGSD